MYLLWISHRLDLVRKDEKGINSGENRRKKPRDQEMDKKRIKSTPQRFEKNAYFFAIRWCAKRVFRYQRKDLPTMNNTQYLS